MMGIPVSQACPFSFVHPILVANTARNFGDRKARWDISSFESIKGTVLDT